MTDEEVERYYEAESAWDYKVGDTVYLDDTAFLVEEVRDSEVQLRDPTLLYPIFRAENRSRFEEMLSRDERNDVLRKNTADEKEAVAEEILDNIRPATVQDYTAEYRLLDRLRTDCEYFLGYGQRYEGHLWAGNVRDQIAKMRELYEAVPEKPEWLTGRNDRQLCRPHGSSLSSGSLPSL